MTLNTGFQKTITPKDCALGCLRRDWADLEALFVVTSMLPYFVFWFTEITGINPHMNHVAHSVNDGYHCAGTFLQVKVVDNFTSPYSYDYSLTLSFSSCKNDCVHGSLFH